MLDIPLERVNQLTKLVPKVLNITLDDVARSRAPTCKREYDRTRRSRELIDIARKLEGTNRNVGTHAAGVVIANGPLTDYVPLQRVARKDERTRTARRSITTQWVMGDLEKVGLLKMDFLGLRTLTLLDNAVKLIEKTRGDDDRPASSCRSTTRRPTSSSSAATPRACSSSNRDGHPRAAQADEAGQHPRPHRHARPSTAPARSTAAWSTTTSTASTAARSRPTRTR